MRWNSRPNNFEMEDGPPLILNLSLEVVVMLMNRNLIDQANLTEVILKYLIQSIKNPDFMLWLGDNTYLRESDWNSRTGFIKRYPHTRALSELQPLLASTHHYATWDDWV